MLMQTDKLGKNPGAKVNEITKSLTTFLHKLQEQDSTIKKHLENLKIDSVQEINLGEKNKKCYLIKVNESSWKSITVVLADIIKKLEAHYNCPVVIVSNRKQINGKIFKKFKGKTTPRQNTLTAVYDSLLDDILFPATVIGKRIRHFKTGQRLFKVHVDNIDKEHIEVKVNALQSCYKQLTNRDLKIEFPNLG